MVRKCGVILYNQQENKYFLVFGRKSKKWGFPKGHQEENETDEETARREFFEETGFRLCHTIELNRKFQVKNNIYYLINIENQNQLIQETSIIPDANEIEFSNWLSKDEILSMNIEQCNFGLKMWILKKFKNIVS